jgi:hypothetical protein
LILIS